MKLLRFQDVEEEMPMVVENRIHAGPKEVPVV